MTDEKSRWKRNVLPEGFGQECPNCGEPFDAGSSGVMFSDDFTQIDVFSWERVCVGPIPEEKWFESDVLDDQPFMYVHKVEHLE